MTYTQLLVLGLDNIQKVDGMALGYIHKAHTIPFHHIWKAHEMPYNEVTNVEN